MNRKRALLLVAVAALAGLVATVAGGGGTDLPRPAPLPGGFGAGAADTVISGSVTCDGKPLTTGAVFFIGGSGLAGQGVVAGDGRYQAGLVPEGPVKVIYCSRPLTERQLQIQLGNPDPGPAGDWIDQPAPAPDVLQKALAAEARYGTPQTGLDYTVVRGRQTFDVTLVTAK
ncbi:hypothetical protein [Frigoriglobus tundricola]|uniref:Secreted protein n=1 Tax=Frigoriglobus tundricola TaxID=2774151 RepID=A0A6M5YNX7_9BACT|nr:hypothetical protein [Frigoriglobus tundricola]QJW95060.1 hypothetical protein FTUN_2586 [Frigoriglobus tundricola]